MFSDIGDVWISQQWWHWHQEPVEVHGMLRTDQSVVLMTTCSKRNNSIFFFFCSCHFYFVFVSVPFLSIVYLALLIFICIVTPRALVTRMYVSVVVHLSCPLYPLVHRFAPLWKEKNKTPLGKNKLKICKTWRKKKVGNRNYSAKWEEKTFNVM